MATSSLPPAQIDLHSIVLSDGQRFFYDMQSITTPSPNNIPVPPPNNAFEDNGSRRWVPKIRQWLPFLILYKVLFNIQPGLCDVILRIHYSIIVFKIYFSCNVISEQAIFLILHNILHLLQ